jgi:hypothetical protein
MSLLADLEIHRATIRSVGRAFVEYVSPNLIYAKRGLAGWPLMELDAALGAAAIYAVIVIVGLALYKKPAVSIEDKATVAKKVIPLAQKFAKEPILYLQFIYNWLQVALCGYMIWESLRVAKDQKYSLVCNSFNGHSKSLGPVLWLFYVSKVR